MLQGREMQAWNWASVKSNGPQACLVVQTVHLQCWRPRFEPWVGKIPWRREWLENSMYSPWGCKESDMTEQLIFPLFTQWTAINMMKHKLSETVKSWSTWSRDLAQKFCVLSHFCPITRYSSVLPWPQVQLLLPLAFPSCSQSSLLCVWSLLLPSSWDLTHFLGFLLQSYGSQTFRTQETPYRATFTQVLGSLEAKTVSTDTKKRTEIITLTPRQ